MPTCIQNILLLALLVVTVVHANGVTGSSIDISSNDESESVLVLNDRYKKPSNQKPNVLIILADDLGYGDTSVTPFVGSGIKTPFLEKMASRGMILTNFHTAAPTCTPTRSSLLTGLFPWRVGLKAVYEYGRKGKSNRDDWLPQIPTLASIFRDANYTTGHSGKWHVGGMRNDDWDMRILPDKGLDDKGLPVVGGRRCPHPGPNQQGFEDVVSVLDGPGSARQNELEIGRCLYSKGCEYLLRNDSKLGRLGSDNMNELLSDCEARHAIRIMTESVNQKKPFFVQLWFHAPHGPWEEIPSFNHLYPAAHRNSGSRKHQYRTMVSAMDSSIGTVLDALQTLGIERNTIVVFLSDNGPEMDTGTVGPNQDTTAGFRANKRFLYEGGIRVPCIWYWPGVVPRGAKSNILSVSTDIFPTVLDAAGIEIPTHIRVDGMSILSEIVGHHHHLKNRKYGRKAINERMVLWHADYECPRTSAATAFEFKLHLNTEDRPSELYDIHADPFEKHNLLPKLSENSDADIASWSSLLSSSSKEPLCPHNMFASTVRSQPWLHKYLVSKMYPILKSFAQHGNAAHVVYLERNRGREYTPSIQSDQRFVVGNPYGSVSREQANKQRQKLIHQTTCGSPCSCEVARASTAQGFPFLEGFKDHMEVIPKGFINATEILGLGLGGTCPIHH